MIINCYNVKRIKIIIRVEVPQEEVIETPTETVESESTPEPQAEEEVEEKPTSTTNEDDDNEDDEDDEEEDDEDEKPVKKQKQLVEDLREHVNIVFIGHVG